jgi:hypothetical protein
VNSIRHRLYPTDPFLYPFFSFFLSFFPLFFIFFKIKFPRRTILYIWDFASGKTPQTILQTKVSLRCVRFLDKGRLLVGVRSRSTTSGMTTYIRAARAQLLLYSFGK